MRVILFEDSWEFFEPISLTRDLGSIRTGILTPERRLWTLLEGKAEVLVLKRDWLGEPADDVVGDLFVNARLNLTKETLDEILKLPPGVGFFKDGDDILAFRSREPLKLKGRWEEVLAEVIGGLEREKKDWDCLEGVWDIPHKVAENIVRDHEILGLKGIEGEISKGVYLIDEERIVVRRGARVGAGVVLDATHGPIVLDEEVEIGHNSVLIGPLFLGRSSRVKMGSKLWGGVSGGPHTRLGGEVEACIFQGYVNKQHDGFFGHSFIGEWVNIGAESTTSDLKNTYGQIRLKFSFGAVETKSQFVGSFIGDHTKCGIHTMFNSGTVIGVFVNAFGGDFLPKFIPSFVWGGPTFGWEEYRLEEAFRVAARVMKRRARNLDERDKELLRTVYSLTKEARVRFLEGG
jgi:UDP-N-acetylglucosamine diphosphorylase/glucosamine-1-phosphate N-acetyltransferase